MRPELSSAEGDGGRGGSQMWGQGLLPSRPAVPAGRLRPSALEQRSPRQPPAPMHTPVYKTWTEEAVWTGPGSASAAVVYPIPLLLLGFISVLPSLLTMDAGYAQHKRDVQIH